MLPLHYRVIKCARSTRCHQSDSPWDIRPGDLIIIATEARDDKFPIDRGPSKSTWRRNHIDMRRIVSLSRVGKDGRGALLPETTWPNAGFVQIVHSRHFCQRQHALNSFTKGSDCGPVARSMMPVFMTE